MIIQSVVLLVLIGGIALMIKGHLVEHHAYVQLGDSLPAKNLFYQPISPSYQPNQKLMNMK